MSNLNSVPSDLNIPQNELITDVELALQRREDISLGALPQDLVVIQGFVGHSPRGDWYRRLYSSIEFNACIEFSLHDVVTWKDLEPPDPPTPISPTIIWLKSDAQIATISAASTSLQRTFLRGKIAGAFGSMNMPGLSAARVGGSFGGCGSYTPCGATPGTQVCPDTQVCGETNTPTAPCCQ